MKEAGYIQGDQIGAIRAEDPITRAEVVTILDKMAAGFVNTDGTYSEDCRGTLIVNTHNVTLKNMTIDGNLIVADGVADGDVYLDKVTVKGDVILRGCGENSFHILPGCEVKNVIVTKTTNGRIRLTNESGETIPMLWIYDGADGVILDGDSFENVIIACDAQVTISAKSVGNVSVTKNAELTIAKGATVSSLELAKTAKETIVTVEGKVTELINDAKVKINNKGTVGTSTGSTSSGSGSSGSDGGNKDNPSGGKKDEILSEVTIQLLAPKFGQTPDEADPLGVGYTTETEWQNADGTAANYRWKGANGGKDSFNADQAYQAIVKLIPTSGYTFAEDLKVIVTDGKMPATEYTPVSITASGKNRMVTIVYEKTEFKEYFESVRMIASPSIIDLNGTGKVTVNAVDNYLVDPANYAYQWYRCDNTKGDNKTPIPGATGPVYDIPTSETGSEKTLYYAVEITVGGKTYASQYANKVQVLKPLDPDTIPIPKLGEILGLSEEYGCGGNLYIRVGMDDYMRDTRIHYNIQLIGNVTIEETGKETIIKENAELDSYGSYYSQAAILSLDYVDMYRAIYRIPGITDNDIIGSNDYVAEKVNNVDITINELKVKVTPQIQNEKGWADIPNKEAEKTFDLSQAPIQIHLIGEDALVEGEAALWGPTNDIQMYVQKDGPNTSAGGSLRRVTGDFFSNQLFPQVTNEEEHYSIRACFDHFFWQQSKSNWATFVYDQSNHEVMKNLDEYKRLYFLYWPTGKAYDGGLETYIYFYRPSIVIDAEND